MDRTEITERLTEKMLAQLEKGVAPWRKPWTGDDGMPASISTGRPYRGFNWFALSLEAMDREYESRWWGTYKQIEKYDGKVRKGEKATPIIFWRILKREQQDASGETATKSIPMMRYYNVFNIEQADGLVLPPRFLPVEREPVEVPAACQTALDAYEGRPEVRHDGGDRAFYRPAEDRIHLPKESAFESPEAYAETLFHELVHSTGHKSRLDRFEAGSERFGCEGYAKEELVAEMGATLLASILRVEIDEDQPAAYIAGWLQKLKDDRSLLISAAQQAQRAVDLILPDGREEDTDGGNEDNE
jgi:antirestriction protein ArdC